MTYVALALLWGGLAFNMLRTASTDAIELQVMVSIQTAITIGFTLFTLYPNL